MNTASLAGFYPGPLMATYYATKAYVVSLSRAVREELRQERSAVTVSILCPGPVRTNFGKNASVDFHFEGFSTTSEYVAEYTLRQLPKFYIVPCAEMKVARWLYKLLPSAVSSRILYSIQNHKV